MNTPQSGIFALGTAAQAYLEFDTPAGGTGREVVAAPSSLREPREGCLDSVHARPLTGAYYFVPSSEALRVLGEPAT